MSRRNLNSIGLVIACLILVYRAWPTAMTLVDDAYISARYALNLASGQGLTYSYGEAPIEGFTNLVWTLFLAAGLLVGAPTVELMVGGGLFFGVLTIVAAVLLTREITTADSMLPVTAGLLLALSPHLAVSCTNGLESSMFAAAVIGLTALTLRAKDRLRPCAGIGAGLLGLIRPEGWAVGGLCWAYDLFTNRDQDIKRRLLFSVPFALVVVLASLLRLWYYGELLPNTFSAKANANYAAIWKTNLRYIGPDGYLWGFTSATACLSLFFPGRRLQRALVVAIAAALIVISFQVSLWMPGARLLVPSYALLLIAAAASLNGLTGKNQAYLALTAGLIIGGLSLQNTHRVRAYDGHHSVLPDNPAQLAAVHLRQHSKRGAWLATRDAGVFAYFVGPELKVAELHGRALTRRHFEGKPADVGAYTPVNPELIVTTVARKNARRMRYDNDRLIFNRATEEYRYLGRVQQHYHRFYDIYVRGDLAIPDLDPAIVINHLGPKKTANREP